MWLQVWFLGWPVMMLGAWLIYILFTKILDPHNKFVFENPNAHGGIALPDWETAVQFRRFELITQVIGNILGFFGMAFAVIGLTMVVVPTCHFLFW